MSGGKRYINRHVKPLNLKISQLQTLKKFKVQELDKNQGNSKETFLIFTHMTVS